ncbi:MAG: hypothetical protein ACD_42C00560G0002 [uncultured bacterium]|nr:MAG: hypothetical protein ACD_42C00560G0002 [uncultured bacterium]OGT25245.1 MAG: hypothetical protein A3B71_01920 [Gammaproteobacteria bacterium RIFCSPHIGHO2_02_FULL_42_43]OGT51199.1 MAG: hypothetical protein A3E54_03110 [Gammaproteobacteria bacterium RIFCSPHIGHO2_12_FULL_41_25]OGT62961.1 MAG: hypothetical protein A3I77_05355 [Gammaproteobacteria bacterium RIFCSPLOWO2_02_FULL_42_14]OGT86093.1 MAG: hypothetical protein A3G86_02910 [Gammaproteobacteria bacterium RIFCSPLOWO2_12_FULL_42_18]
MKCSVEITEDAVDQIANVPFYIARKLEYWINAVEQYGIETVRKVRGYHDEPLQGNRKGQRSIRLNKAYRAIYIETKTHEVKLILIVEVNKHDY